MKLLDGVKGDAVLSPDGRYRYALTRAWDGSRPRGVWIMLNPSTADADTDDQTLRQVQHFSRSWGQGSLVVVNLFAFRATDPVALRTAADPVGPVNHEIIEAMVSGPRVDRIVAAWGVNAARWPGRVAEVLALVEVYREGRPLSCLGRTAGGHPRHPCRLAHDTPLEPFTSTG